MTEAGGIDVPSQAWADACLNAALFAIDPAATGGVLLRSAAGPVRERRLAYVRALLPPAMPVHPAPSHISLDRLLGGLDLAATLVSGRRVLETGVLTRADGGVVILAMAERWSATHCAHVASALDRGTVQLERDGLQASLVARIGVIACDEGYLRQKPALIAVPVWGALGFAGFFECP